VVSAQLFIAEGAAVLVTPDGGVLAVEECGFGGLTGRVFVRGRKIHLQSHDRSPARGSPFLVLVMFLTTCEPNKQHTRVLVTFRSVVFVEQKIGYYCHTISGKSKCQQKRYLSFTETISSSYRGLPALCRPG